MIVCIYNTDGGDYRLCAGEESISCETKIDVTQKFYERYQAYEAEEEFIQSKLHRYYQEAKTASILKKSREEGIPSKGF